MEYTHKPVDELSFTDDFMFGTVMKDKGTCKGVIEHGNQVLPKRGNNA